MEGEGAQEGDGGGLDQGGSSWEALRRGLVLDLKGWSSQWDVLLTDGTPGVTERSRSNAGMQPPLASLTESFQ